jgi:putative nucleotidyltransferase with HDIG domain
MSASTPVLKSPTTPPAGSPVARQPERRGVQRLLHAFESVENLPSLSESRHRAELALARGGAVSCNELIGVIERDVGMCAKVLRAAAKADVPRRRPQSSSVASAVQVLGEQRIGQLVTEMDTYSPFAPHPILGRSLEQLRLHSIEVRKIAGALAKTVGHPNPDALSSAAMLHDIGKLVLAYAYPGYPQRVHGEAISPNARRDTEQRLLGLDHATVGGVLVRRWGLPSSVADLVSHHHSDRPDAALLRLADTLAHHTHGRLSESQVLAEQTAAAGLEPNQLEVVMYEVGDSGTATHAASACPLSPKERLVVAELATGSSYKQIALNMQLSTSTVRTHLHNVYGKLGVSDRAQAVLHAVALGWVEAPSLSSAPDQASAATA